MNQELKPLFVAALRSGKFKQTKTILVQKKEGAGIPVGYCCLGVGCVVAGISISENGKQALDENGNEDAYRPIRDKLRLNEQEVSKLYTMNDTEGKTFEEIADYIETHL